MNKNWEKFSENYIANATLIYEKYCKDSTRSLNLFYHFTNASSLQKIIARQQLLLTDFRHLNDNSELFYGISLINEAICKSSLSLILKKRVLSFLEKFKVGIEDGKYMRTYVSCGVDHTDSLLLWRLYGDNGSGFAIGFDFFSDPHPDFNIPVEEELKLVKLEYDKKAFKELIQPLLNVNLEGVPTGNYENVILLIFEYLLYYLPIAKHPDFHFEKEYRLYFSEGGLIRREKFPNGFSFPPERRLHFTKPNKEGSPTINGVEILDPQLKPIQEKEGVLSLPFLKNRIREIWVGPRCDFLITKVEIEKLLTEHQYDLSQIKIEPYDSSFVG